MRTLLAALVLSIPALSPAQSSVDRTKELSASRVELTSEFAKIQAQLRSKEAAEKSAGEAGLVQLAPKVEALRDQLVQANQGLIQAFSQQPYFYGAHDPSATILASLGKMLRENRELAAISLPAIPPFYPQDVNRFQQGLDRVKRGIDEHRHAAGNHAATLVQRQRKPVTPTKTPAKLPN